jgi:hypothetical protein
MDMKKWIVKFYDGSTVTIKAAKYDPKMGVFLNGKGEMIGQVPHASMQIVKIFDEGDRKTEAPTEIG